MKDPATKIAEVQAVLDGITKDGFWFYISFAEGDRLNLLPHKLEVVAAQPVIGRDGQIERWRYSIVVVDRGFADFGASVHGQHLHIVERIEWVRGGSDRIYAAYLREAPGEATIYVNELHAGEYPDEARAWDEHARRIAAIPERAEECLATIREEFRPMAEGELRG